MNLAARALAWRCEWPLYAWSRGEVGQDVTQFLQVGRCTCPGARVDAYNNLTTRFCEVNTHDLPHGSVVAEVAEVATDNSSL